MNTSMGTTGVWPPGVVTWMSYVPVTRVGGTIAVIRLVEMLVKLAAVGRPPPTGVKATLTVSSRQEPLTVTSEPMEADVGTTPVTDGAL